MLPHYASYSLGWHTAGAASPNTDSCNGVCTTTIAHGIGRRSCSPSPSHSRSPNNAGSVRPEYREIGAVGGEFESGRVRHWRGDSQDETRTGQGVTAVEFGFTRWKKRWQQNCEYLCYCCWCFWCAPLSESRSNCINQLLRQLHRRREQRCPVGRLLSGRIRDKFRCLSSIELSPPFCSSRAGSRREAARLAPHLADLVLFAVQTPFTAVVCSRSRRHVVGIAGKPRRGQGGT